jgi:acyl transferase domain-containing protein/phospholipid N-methyltransferase
LSPLKQALAVIRHLEKQLATVRSTEHEPIAVIGMGCRFPGGASNPELYWQLLCNGFDAVGPIPEDRWTVNEYYDPDRNAPGKIYTRFASLLKDLSEFDAGFFGISQQEACSLDPQHRLCLEVIWETLEHAAIPPASLKESQTGVFIGIGQNDYTKRQLHAGEPERINRYDGSGNGFCFAPGRVSYTLGLHGPSIAIDCACSGSLVAIHLACQSLRARECDLALAGGVHLILDPAVTVFLCRVGALSPDGRCKAFDAAADGFGRGEGCGAVALKRLNDALADGDFIWATLPGSVVNHDGPSAGLTVPSVTAQINLLSRALGVAGLESRSVGYIEAHGTGTLLGDPIEVEALAAVYGRDRPRGNPLWLASGKTNYGHLESAAGVAGFIKAVLSLHHRKLPPHLHFRTPSPHIPWDSTPFRIPTELIDWPADSGRIAGVSSFGLAGTNAHLLLEAGPAGPRVPTAHSGQLSPLLISARSREAASELAARYASYWEQHPELEVADVCRTAALGRDHFKHRVAVLAGPREDFCRRLRAISKGESPPGTWTGPKPAGQSSGTARSARSALEKAMSNYVSGLPIAWKDLFPVGQGNCPVVLPTYPFERRRYWIEKSEGLPPEITGAGSGRAFSDAAEYLYEVVWQPVREEQKRDLSSHSGLWIVLCDTGGVGDLIAKGLRAEGQRCLCVRAGPGTAQQGVDEWTVSLGDSSPFDGLLHSLSAESITGILHCWSLGSQPITSATGLSAVRQAGCISALRLFQALRRLKSQRSPRIWLITQGCQAVANGLVEAGLPQSMLWGFGRCIALDWPELWGGLQDLPPNLEPADLEGTVQQLLCPTMEQAAWRQGRPWIPRIRRAEIPKRQLGALALRPDGTYWVTGGWGALGLRLANWLVEHGAGAIILSARREPTAEARAFAQTCEERGLRVWLRRADCADPQATTEIVGEIDAAGSRLRGVFHAAGVGGYMDTGALTASEFERVCRAKVEGAWNLHELTRGHDLDHFILFSSIASVWGAKAQTHYAAANHFLDTLASWRRTLGLPAISVSWGPWSGGGLMTTEAEQKLEEIGVSSLQPGVGLRSLETLMLGAAAPQTIVADIDWGRFAALFAALPRYSLFTYLDGSSTESDMDKAFSYAQQAMPTKIAAAQNAGNPEEEKVEKRSVKKRSDQREEHSILRLRELENARYEPIAVIGAGLRFPGNATSLESFWHLLLTKHDAVARVPANRWDSDEYYDPDFSKPGRIYSQEGAFLDRIEEFDAEFFRISPREALSLDPQQRLLLEVTWEALENAGIRPSTLAGTTTGVFIGISNNDYTLRLVGQDFSRIDAHFVTGNALNAAAGRISYILGLQGPSLAIDTACSSSLVAVHLACQSLRAGECQVALVGGVNLMLSPAGSIAACRARMLAPDGRCKTFDASADGYGRGEGCGIVVLKRLSDALRSGATLEGLIRGSAVNQDGASSGLTVPNGPAQGKLIAQALNAARLRANQISYLETHGTGTSLGDPIEYRAAVATYGMNRARPLILGAVKANIGHLESAAGIAGLLKAMLVLQHRTVPPQPHFNTPNPYIPWEELPSIVPGSELRLDEADQFAAVSSFGASGTNAHVILETAPRPALKARSVRKQPRCLLVFTAKAPTALVDLASAYAKLAESRPTAELVDLCYSAATQRDAFTNRAAVIAADWGDLENKLKAFISGTTVPGVFQGVCQIGTVPPRMQEATADAPESDNAVIWENFLAEEARRYIAGGPPPLHANADNSRRVRLPTYPWQRMRFWPDEDRRVAALHEVKSGSVSTPPESQIDDWFYQPSWKVRPLTTGDRLSHEFPSPAAIRDRLAAQIALLEQNSTTISFCEFIQTLERASTGYLVEALETLGWKWQEGERYSLDEFMKFSGVRTGYRRLLVRLFQILEEDGLVSRAGETWRVTSITNVEKARQAQATAISDYRADSIEGQMLHRCASKLPAVLRGECAPLKLLFPGDGSVSAAHLYAESAGAKMINGLVSDTIRQLLSALSPYHQIRVLEVGAGTGGTTKEILSLFPREQTRYVMTDVAPLLVNEARDHFSKYEFVDFGILDIERSPEAQGFKLGTYDLVVAANVLHATRNIAASLIHIRQLLKPGGLLVLLEGTGPVRFIDLIFGLTDGWWRFQDPPLRHDHALISVSAWKSVLGANGFFQSASLDSAERANGLLSKQAILIARTDVESSIRVLAEPRRWLLFADRGGIADRVRRSLLSRADRVLIVRTQQSGNASSDDQSHGQIILRSAATEEIHHCFKNLQIDSLAGVVHFSGCDANIKESSSPIEIAEACEMSSRTALAVLQGVLARGTSVRPAIYIVTRGTAPVPSPEIVGMPQSPLWGMLKCAALESPGWKCTCIDLPLDPSDSVLQALADELSNDEPEREIALREKRWVPRLVRVVAPAPASFRLHAEATYLITGGSRGLGPAVGLWLAQRGAKNLVLISRTEPDPDAERTFERARAAGCLTTWLRADVSQEDQLRVVLATIRSSMPPLRGVIHGAGALDDSSIVHQNWKRFRHVFSAKIDGAWALHRLTQDIPLDFFVMFSSMASLFGSPGQSNHGAANAFLDALAQYRKSRGLPAISINWGPWSEIGAAARHRVADRVSGKGIGAISTESGLSALERCMSFPAAQVGIVPIDWPVFHGQSPHDQRETWLSAFTQFTASPLTTASPGPPGTQSHQKLIQQINEAEARTRPDLLCQYVETRVRQVLRAGTATELGRHRPLLELGLDSLMSTELNNRFVSELGVDVPMQIMIGSATISDLAQHLEDRLTLARAATEASAVDMETAEMEDITL